MTPHQTGDVPSTPGLFAVLMPAIPAPAPVFVIDNVAPALLPVLASGSVIAFADDNKTALIAIITADFEKFLQ
jgi:hypothetical protein